MFGWFRKKPETPPAPPADHRDWNEDWKVGDTAECIVDGVSRKWFKDMEPWKRPHFGQRFIVIGFSEGIAARDNTRRYFLRLEGWDYEISTTAFRKVRPVATEESEVVQRILNAKPGADRTRETVED